MGIYLEKRSKHHSRVDNIQFNILPDITFITLVAIYSIIFSSHIITYHFLENRFWNWHCWSLLYQSFSQIIFSFDISLNKRAPNFKCLSCHLLTTQDNNLLFFTSQNSRFSFCWGLFSRNKLGLCS